MESFGWGEEIFRIVVYLGKKSLMHKSGEMQACNIQFMIFLLKVANLRNVWINFVGLLNNNARK